MANVYTQTGVLTESAKIKMRVGGRGSMVTHSIDLQAGQLATIVVVVHEAQEKPTFPAAPAKSDTSQDSVPF